MDIKDTQRCHSNKTRLGMNETKYRYGFNITSCFHPVTTVSVYIYNWEFHELNGKSPSNCGLGFRSLTNKKITCYPSWVWVCVFVWVCECVWVCCSGWMLDQTANDIYTPTNVDTICAVTDTPIPVSVARGKTPPHHHFLVAMPVPAWL